MIGRTYRACATKETGSSALCQQAADDTDHVLKAEIPVAPGMPFSGL
jgi:hypothetical protein